MTLALKPDRIFSPLEPFLLGRIGATIVGVEVIGGGGLDRSVIVVVCLAPGNDDGGGRDGCAFAKSRGLLDGGPGLLDGGPGLFVNAGGLVDGGPFLGAGLLLGGKPLPEELLEFRTGSNERSKLY